MKVALIMGSDSDLPILEPALKIFKEFDVNCDVVVASAHRTPQKVHDFVNNSEQSGVKVFLAAAGAAAHLPGVVASLTTLPVIGIPINSTSLGGMDALLSIAQMPAGIPVATMAINGAKNAAIFAIQILATDKPDLLIKLKAFRKEMEEEVAVKEAKAKEKLLKLI